jgi:ERCC4-type nuclease
MTSILLEVDNRERQLIEYFNNSKTSIHVCSLDVGDIRLSYDNTTILIIERKTIADLDQSIKDGRYRDQKKRLLDNYDRKHIMYIVEGDMYLFPDKSDERIKGAVINTLIRDDLKVVCLKNVQQTSMFINDIVKRVEKEPLKYVMTADISDIPPTTMVKHTRNMYITKDVFCTMALCNIPGVSSFTARALFDHYGTLQKIVTEANKEVIAEIRLPSGKRIGHKVAAKICDYLCM